MGRRPLVRVMCHSRPGTARAHRWALAELAELQELRAELAARDAGPGGREQWPGPRCRFRSIRTCCGMAVVTPWGPRHTGATGLARAQEYPAQVRYTELAPERRCCDRVPANRPSIKRNPTSTVGDLAASRVGS